MGLEAGQCEGLRGELRCAGLVPLGRQRGRSQAPARGLRGLPCVLGRFQQLGCKTCCNIPNSNGASEAPGLQSQAQCGLPAARPPRALGSLCAPRNCPRLSLSGAEDLPAVVLNLRGICTSSSGRRCSCIYTAKCFMLGSNTHTYTYIYKGFL